MSTDQRHKRFAVIGGGSWGTALVKMLQQNSVEISWWHRKEKSVEYLKQFGHNPKYLTAVSFDVSKMLVSSDVLEVVKDADVVILAVPSAFLEAVFDQLPQGAMQGKAVISAVKGIIPEKNLIVGDYLHHERGIPFDNIGVITGPCHAEEVALEKLSYLTVACQDADIAQIVADKISSRFVKTTVSDDIFGTEYAAVMKNVMAIACGLAHGLSYGDNFQAVLVSNAIQEIDRFVKARYPLKRDIKSSAYLGDLLVTAYSQFSRNRTLGTMIGKGYTIQSALMEMGMVAEGYYAVECVQKMNQQLAVNMPITEAVHNILYRRSNPVLEMRRLESQLS